MKFFLFGGLIVGAVVTLVGIWLFADKIDYITNGISTPATVIGFDLRTEKYKSFKNHYETRTIYYPVFEYSFQGNRYEHTHDSRQLDQSRPYSLGQSTRVLCSAKQPKKPFVGTLVQLVMGKMLVALSGLAIMLVCGVMALIAWWRDDLEDRPVTYVSQLGY